jgi:hypothetical protein
LFALRKAARSAVERLLGGSVCGVPGATERGLFQSIAQACFVTSERIDSMSEVRQTVASEKPLGAWSDCERQSRRTRTRGPRGPKKLIVVGVRVDDEWLRQLTRWISENEPEMSRPEAVRRLVELGLRANPKP